MLLYMFHSLSTVFALAKWRDASLQTSHTQDQNTPRHVIQSAICLLSILFSIYV